MNEVPNPTLANFARHYLRTRRRQGEALLEAAYWLSEARAQIPHGEWYTFLETNDTSIDSAERLLQLHRQASRNPAFAEAVRTNWLHPAAALLLARPSTPPDVIDAVLAAPEPLTTTAIADLIRTAKNTEPPPTPPSPVATDVGPGADQAPLSCAAGNGRGAAGEGLLTEG